MLDRFCLVYKHVHYVPEAHFKYIKETRILNDMMPVSLVWMEEPLQERRYFGLQKRHKPVKKVTASHFQVTKTFVGALKPLTFARFDGFAIDCVTQKLCLLPDAFRLHYTLEKRGINPLYTKPFMKYRVAQDMDYMFGGGTTSAQLPKHMQVMKQFGYVSDRGEFNFEQLSKDLHTYSRRVEDALQDCRNKLIELRGGVVSSASSPTFDRSQFSLDPASIKQQAQQQLSNDEEDSSSF